MASRLNNAGMNTILLAMMIGFFSIAMTAQVGFLISGHKKIVLKQIATSNQQGLLDQIVHRAVVDLRREYALSPVGLSKLLLGTSVTFKSALPKRYGKGQFQIDQMDALGVVSDKFYSPESDVSAWIDAPVGGTYYLLTVSTNFCKTLVPGRVKYPAESTTNPTPGLGIAWSPACPADQIRPVRYTTYVNQNYWALGN